jgi:hypothetical protein
MHAAAVTGALVRTLNAELGIVGRSLMTARDYTPGANFVLPFMQTPGNSFKAFWQRAPALSLFSLENWRAIGAGGAARDMALSRMLLGHAVGGVVAWHVVNGNITGALPVGSSRELNRDFKQEGGQKFAIRAGDEYYYYKRTDPVGQYIGAIATAIEIYSQKTMADYGVMPFDDFAVAASLAAARTALDTPWLMGLKNVLEAIEKPDQRGKALAESFARSVVPAGVRHLTRSGVPFSLEARPEVRELDTLLDAIKASTPWLVNGVAPYLHPITGDSTYYPPGWTADIISPIYVTTRKNDPVLNEIIRHRMQFPEPPKAITPGPKEQGAFAIDPARGLPAVPLDADEYFRLKQIATREIQSNGRTLHDVMAAAIASPGYARLSDGPQGGKEQLLKKLYHDTYDLARLKLLDERADLRERVNGWRDLRARRQLPIDNPQAVPVPADIPASLRR